MTKGAIRKRAGAFAVATALGVGLVPTAQLAAQAHSFTANSTVTINWNSDGRRFFGQVSSQRAACERGRVVKLHKVGTGVVAQTTTNKFGNWTIKKRRARGRYYASIRSRIRSGYGHFHRCKGDRSPTIRVRRR